MSEAINLSDTLNKMADYLEKNGWRRGWFWGNMQEDGTSCACVMGAAIIALGGNTHETPSQVWPVGNEPGWRAYNEVSKALVSGTRFDNAPAWNDVCNSKEQVIARCRAAAKEVAL